MLPGPVAQVRLKPGREHSGPTPNGYGISKESKPKPQPAEQFLPLVFTVTAVGDSTASSPSTIVAIAMAAMFIFGVRICIQCYCVLSEWVRGPSFYVIAVEEGGMQLCHFRG